MLLAEGSRRRRCTAAEVALEQAKHGWARTVGDGSTIALEAAFALGDRAKMDALLAIVEQAPARLVEACLRAIGAHFGARRAALTVTGDGWCRLLRRGPDLPEMPSVPFELGACLSSTPSGSPASGQIDDAAPLAAEAREIFERLRATPYIERLDRLTRTELRVSHSAQACS